MPNRNKSFLDELGSIVVFGLILWPLLPLIMILGIISLFVMYMGKSATLVFLLISILMACMCNVFDPHNEGPGPVGTIALCVFGGGYFVAASYINHVKTKKPTPPATGGPATKRTP